MDARATDIKLIIKDGGKSLIQVIDNGLGMSVTDARLCFERHATSKIRQAEDLFSLHTKGFRGEALGFDCRYCSCGDENEASQEELGTHIVLKEVNLSLRKWRFCPKGLPFRLRICFLIFQHDVIF